MPAVPDIRYTAADYKRWEGDWELLEGHPVALSPAPVVAHQRLAFKIMMALEETLEVCPSCQAIPEAAWHVDDDTVFRPDGEVELPLHEECTARLDFTRVFHRL